MKSIMLELVPIDPGLDTMLANLKKVYQIVPEYHVVEKIKKDSFENTVDGREYVIFENYNWRICGKIDDEDTQSIWVEVFIKA